MWLGMSRYNPFAQKYVEISAASAAVPVDAAIQFVIQGNLDRDGFKYLACGTRPVHEVTWPSWLVIVLDSDKDFEGLSKGGRWATWSILRVQDIFEGPDVWLDVW